MAVTNTPDPTNEDCDRRPRLRRLEVSQGKHGGQGGLVLRDPLALVDPIFVPAGLVPLLARLDGSMTVEQLQRAVERGNPGGPPDFVRGFVNDLEQRLALESPLVEERLGAVVAAFLAAGARPARHAGSAGYPRERAALEDALRRVVPPANPGAARGAAARGLIAPHIDLARGQLGYAAAYGRMACSEPADLYVIFGTGHRGPSAPVTGLALDWNTPLGTVRTDREFVARVHAAIGGPDRGDVLLHRDEHSVELQVLMLRWILGERPFEVAGFLCGAVPSETGDPLQEPYVQDLLAAFRDAAERAHKRVCWVAGADLAHLGPYFGDAQPVGGELLKGLEERERARLALLERGDVGAFVRGVEDAANPDRVCGTSPIFFTGALAGGAAELLHYGQAAAEDGSQVVSFCAAVFADQAP